MTPAENRDATLPTTNDCVRYKSAQQPCIECPFTKKMADTPSPQGWYDQTNFERVWRGVAKEGRFLGCHMFDLQDLTGYTDETQRLGYQAPTDLKGRKECAGMSGMVYRELQEGLKYPNWDAYIKARPTGLQRDVFAYMYKRLTGAAQPPLTVPADPGNPDLIHPGERVNTDSMLWLHPEDALHKIQSTLERVTAGLMAFLDTDSAPVSPDYLELLEVLSDAGIPLKEHTPGPPVTIMFMRMTDVQRKLAQTIGSIENVDVLSNPAVTQALISESALRDVISLVRTLDK
jgi:hypothetical protein